VSDPLLDRQVRRKLAVLRHVAEVAGNVPMTCRVMAQHSHGPPAASAPDDGRTPPQR
jgi:hypothetical protein